jgi:phenylpropionate dioxygenase-like ring-hydroxylating dioxygenase large terminal subunit
MYSSHAVFRAELEHIHLRSWFFVGLAAELPEPGDYSAIETVGGPAILVRDGSGTLRAFANCCRHRGSLLLSGQGRVRAIRCPYHAWTYRLDGSLLAVPAMERTEGFDKLVHGLAPIRLEEWDGLVFLNFDAAAQPLSAYLGDLPRKLGCYRFADMVCTWRHEIECRCNWKMLVENALEAYHTGTVHAATVGAQHEAMIPTQGNWVCLQVLSARSIAVLEDEPPFPPIEGLSAEARRGTYFTMVLPTSQLACAQDCMWWLSVRPVAADRTVLSLGGCFPKPTVSLPRFETEAPLYYERWRLVAEEDVGILEAQQRGVSSVLFRPGRLSWRDELAHAVHRWVLDRLPAG